MAEAAAGRLPTTVRTAQGHLNTVEDVVWRPDSVTELASVGDDHALMLWDIRAAKCPAARVLEAHGAHDVHCVDWSGLQPHLLATGAPLSVPQQSEPGALLGFGDPVLAWAACVAKAHALHCLASLSPHVLAPGARPPSRLSMWCPGCEMRIMPAVLAGCPAPSLAVPALDR